MATRKGVGIFVGSYLPYSETFIYDQISNQQRYAPIVFADSLGGAHDQFPFSNVVALSGLARTRYRVLGSSPTFDAELKTQKPALLHAHFGTNGVYATPFAKRHNLPLIVTFHGHDVPALIGRSRFHTRYARYAALSAGMLKQADLFLPASQDLADKLINEIGAPSSKVQVLRLGIDVEKFCPSTVVKDKGPEVLMVGRFVEKKGHLYGIRAFAQALKKVPEAKLKLVGDGPLLTVYQEEVNKLNIQHAVHFAGALPHEAVKAAMQSADILLCPSVTASNGDVESGVIVIKEAGACGLPTIGTRHGGIPEILVDGITGFLVEERDIYLTANHLAGLLRDTSFRKQMGAEARSHIEAHFNLKTQIARLESLYDSLL